MMKGYTMKRDIVERVEKMSDPDDLYVSLFNVRMQHTHIKNRALSDTKPCYNKYVKVFSRDTIYLYEQMLELLEYLIVKVDRLENGAGDRGY